MLDTLESGSSKLSVNNQSNKDAHGYVISDFYIADDHFGSDAIIVAYIHIGVGFGVARSTDRAMPEPQSVGRVARELPRFFMYRKVIVIAKF